MSSSSLSPFGNDNSNNASSSSLDFNEACLQHPDTEMQVVVDEQHDDSLHLSGLSREDSTDDLLSVSIDQQQPDENDQQEQFGNSNSTGLTFQTASSTTTVELVAPAHLPAGYQFVATVGDNHEQILVEVFERPVMAGQRFEAMVVRQPPSSWWTSPRRSPRLRAQPGHSIPHGYWRDGLLSGCARFGPCHAVACMACWCSPLLLAQVMTRLGLDAWGQYTLEDDNNVLPLKDVDGHGDNNDQTNRKPQWSLFRLLATVLLTHFILIETVLSALVMMQIHARREGRVAHVPAWAFMLLAVRAACRSLLLLYVLTISYRTRRILRRRYRIPEQHLECGVEDAVVTATCHLCSVAQMARHTADYDTYEAHCCTATGLSAFAPAWV